MKQRIYLLFALLAFCYASLHAKGLFTYAEHSVLQQGNWVKIAVKASGVHKLTYQDLLSMGFASPEKVRVYGYGGAMLAEHFKANARIADDLPEVPMHIEKGSDGIFGKDDYLLFYAQGPNTVTYNTATKAFQVQQHPYSKLGYYFLTDQDGDALPIGQQPPVQGIDTLRINTSYNYWWHENEQYNLLESGREWYGEQFTTSTKSRTFSATLSFLADPNIHFSMRAVGTGDGTQYLHVTMDDNTADLYMYNSSGSHQVGVAGSIAENFTYNGSSKASIKVTYPSSYSGQTAYIDYIGITYQQQLQLTSDELSIFYPNKHANSRIAHYSIATQANDILVWDITNPYAPVSLPYQQQADSLHFYAEHSSQRQFVAFSSKGSFPTPTFVAQVAPQDLHSWGNTDMVIISPEAYVEQAERLARHHRQHDGLTVSVVTPDAIYNEFSSGTPDASAYRWLMKMLYDRAESEATQPKHLLFLGVAYYDNKGIKHEVPSLLSYQSKESLNKSSSYITDDYFGLLEDGEGSRIESGTLDIGIGRLPVSSAKEAQQCIDKIINYVQNSSYGTWRNTFTFLADDEDSNLHVRQANVLADSLLRYNAAFSAQKIWLDAYPMEQNATGATYPQAKEAVLRQIKEGTLVFTYVGHGSPQTLTSELTISKSDIAYMNNTNLGLWVTATCDFSRFDNYERSAGMEVVLNPNGGGIASFTTTRVVFSSSNFNLTQSIYKSLVPKKGEPKLALGDIVKFSKNRLVGDRNKLNFCLLGDPAITLHYPQWNVSTDSINGIDPKDAELGALALVTINASVRDENNELIEDYQGAAHVTLYDKSEELHTLASKGDESFAYQDYINKLFSGKVAINDGKMQFTFMVPKDINYALGKGRLTYYIVDDPAFTDGQGFCHDFTVGGHSSYVDPSETGPSIRMYINSPAFVNGQQVNNQPILFAHLSDLFGINTVGAGIGHDLTLRYANKPNETINLNAYYESSLNDYKNGVIRYPLGNLAEGTYSLELKAWNLQNISSTASIQFVVKDNLAPKIDHFNIFPNPIKNQATLSVQYDRPDDIGQIEFFIYDLAGRLCWQSSEVLQTAEGYYNTTLVLNEAGGCELLGGLYLAKVKITTSQGTSTENTQKIIVLTQ